jgi:iron(III) transport system ATP-binding protein
MKKVSVECRNIRLSYGTTEVLKNVNLNIEPGEFFALLGPSGSGKSTLLRLIAGFNQHQHGQLLIDGNDVTGMPPWDRNIGMVFQSYALWPHLTVWDNVAFGLVERRMGRAVIKAKVAAALDTVGLTSYAQRKPSQLSGGQQQRVALARTIVIEPQVLLLDEPLSNLDKSLRVQMRQELLALQRRLGITTIFVTHDQEEAMTTADRMAILDKGVLQQVGSPSTLYDYPVNPFVANFVGTMNSLQGRVHSRHGSTVMLDIEGVGDLPFQLNTDRILCVWTWPTQPETPVSFGCRALWKHLSSWASSRVTACGWAARRWRLISPTMPACPSFPPEAPSVWAWSPRRFGSSPLDVELTELAWSYTKFVPLSPWRGWAMSPKRPMCCV